METDKEFNALLQILSAEQQIIQRTDQKAFTLLSILGVFMVFFIVHLPKIQLTPLIFTLVMIYFSAGIGTIYSLIRVIAPRIQKRKVKMQSGEVEKPEVINPTFFAGISQFKSPEEYAINLKSISQDDELLYQMFASQVFSLGNINSVKNENIRKSIYFFITAIVSELLIIMSMAYARALPFIFPNG